MKPGNRLPADNDGAAMRSPGNVENNVSGVLIFSLFVRQSLHRSSRNSRCSQGGPGLVQNFLGSFLGGRNPTMLLRLQAGIQLGLFPRDFRPAVFNQFRRQRRQNMEQKNVKSLSLSYKLAGVFHRAFRRGRIVKNHEESCFRHRVASYLSHPGAADSDKSTIRETGSGIDTLPSAHPTEWAASWTAISISL